MTISSYCQVKLSCYSADVFSLGLKPPFKPPPCRWTFIVVLSAITTLRTLWKTYHPSLKITKFLLRIFKKIQIISCDKASWAHYSQSFTAIWIQFFLRNFWEIYGSTLIFINRPQQEKTSLWEILGRDVESRSLADACFRNKSLLHK